MSDINDNAPLPQWTVYNVSQGLLTHRGRVLLVGNDYGGPELVWSLPGGRLEPGEQHQEALVREFREETGLMVTPLELLYVVDARTARDRRHFITCVFEVQAVPSGEDEPEASPGDDAAVKAIRWVAFEEVAALIQRPSLGEGLVNYLYYGPHRLPRRYWSYPEYWSPLWQPLSWPPLQS